MSKTKFEDLNIKTQLILYMRVASSMKEGIFCTSDPKHHTAADELISGGFIIEIDGPGGADRAFTLTDKGKSAPENSYI